MRLTALLTGPVVPPAWIEYVDAWLGTWPKPDDAGSLSVPPMGWVSPGQSQSPDQVPQ